MPLALRCITKGKWYKEPWVRDGEVKGDALSDLQTREGKLSIWIIDEDHGNLEQVIAAIASGRDFVEHLDYALVDWQRLVGELDLEVETTLGPTQDVDCNRYHCDMVHLTASQVSAIARTIRVAGRLERKQEREVADLLNQAFQSKKINPSMVKAKLRESFEQKRSRWGL